MTDTDETVWSAESSDEGDACSVGATWGCDTASDGSDPADVAVVHEGAIIGKRCE